jgi:hypothetical protein
MKSLNGTPFKRIYTLCDVQYCVCLLKVLKCHLRELWGRSEMHALERFRG